MYYVVDTDEPCERAVADLESVVERHGFGVRQVHDLPDGGRGATKRRQER